MNERVTKVLLVSAAAILLVAAAWLFFSPQEPSPQVEMSPARRARQQTHVPAPQPAQQPAEPQQPSHVPPARPRPPPKPVEPEPLQLTGENAVRISPSHVFATVNGMAVRGTDLLLFGQSASAEQAVMPEQYEVLLDRAIQRELLVQEAHKQQLQLNPDQSNQLAQVRATVAARQGGDVNAVYLSAHGTLEEQTAFEIRDAEAMLFQNSLLEKQGIPPPYVTEEQVQVYYNQHKDTYGELPEDPAARATVWQDIDLRIRNELTPQLQAEYQQKLTNFIGNLKSAAKIQTAVPEN